MSAANAAPDADIVVIGAGVVGLACAAQLARHGSLLVLERNANIASESSSRNSGVIHAGIYYPHDSLKAQLCVRGRALLYERCARLGIGHRKTGKLIVATDAAEETAVAQLLTRGLHNGAGELQALSGQQLQALEPNVRGCFALLSPETGIVDAYALARSYLHEANERGAQLCLKTQVIGLHRVGDSWIIDTQDAMGTQTRLRARHVINAAGLAADRIAALAGVDIDQRALRLRLCKGDYFELSTRLRDLTRHLVYPAPQQAGLGVHVTFDLGGRLLAGPDATYVDAVDYAVDVGKTAAFGAALRRYLPDVRDDDLTPAYAGVRPKLQGLGESFRDFVLDQSLPGLINLIGIESPGLTASAALGEHVARVAFAH